jgi:ABC-2 type transport system ATP-binding protein
MALSTLPAMSIPAIQVSGVSKTYRSFRSSVTALSDVTFNVQPGEVVGLIGPNGAGKSTLLRILLGFLTPDGGATVRFFGHAPDDLTSRSWTGYQADSVFRSPTLTVRRFLRFHADLLRPMALPGQVEAYLNAFSLDRAADRSLSSMSKGMRQKVELMLAFLGSPKIVLLDEPTASLDPPSVFELREFLVARKKEGVTVFFSSHNLTEVENVCSRVLFINDGRLLADYGMDGRGPGFLEEAFRQHLVERRIA